MILIFCQQSLPKRIVHRTHVHIHTIHMMTSSNGNIFRVTGPLCREFTGHRWIPLTKASDAELWCFLWSAINGWVNSREAGDLRRYRADYDVTVMTNTQYTHRLNVESKAFSRESPYSSMITHRIKNSHLLQILFLRLCSELNNWNVVTWPKSQRVSGPKQ